MRPGVFLDRDGTLIEDVGYLRDPAAVRLLPGAAAAVARLNARGLPAVVVTNQSGIARGLLSEADYRAAERRLDELLAAAGARVAAHYFCPHLPELTGPCECRKPGVALYRAAAGRFDLDLARSWWVGDRPRDVAPAASLGGRAVLLGGRGAPRPAGDGGCGDGGYGDGGYGDGGYGDLPGVPMSERLWHAADLAGAVELILAAS